MGEVEVNCRIGSLEMSLQALDFRLEVNCRIGSLEIQGTFPLQVP